MKHPFVIYIVLCLWCWAPLAQLRAIPLSVFLGGSPPPAGAGESPGTSGLLAWWAMTTNADSSGNGRTLNESGTITNSAGLVDDAGYNASTGALFLGDAAWMTPAGDFSIGLWVKPDDGRPATQGRGLFAQFGTAATTKSYLLLLGTDGSLNAYVSGDGNAQIQTISTTNFADGPASSWTYVVLVFKASTALRIYVNGNLENSNTTSIPASVYNATVGIDVFRYAGNNSNTLVGGIDEIHFYGKELSQDNITWLYNNGNGRTFTDL